MFDQNFRVYSVRKVWGQLKCEGFDRYCPLHHIATDAGSEFAKSHQGQIRRNHDQRQSRTMPTGSRQRQSPNVLWLSDFTYLVTWTGFAYVAREIDGYPRSIVSLRPSRTAHLGFVPDALEQLCIIGNRSIAERSRIIATAATQYVSITYTGHLAEAGVEPSVGSVRDSYDNALAENHQRS